MRLTNDPDLVDIAFQLSDGRVLLEAVPSSGSYGEAFGTVGGLIAGLANSRGQALLDLLKADPDVSQRLSEDELDALFDLDYHFKHVDAVFDRLFGERG